MTPVGPGNRLAERHGFCATILTPVEQADLAEIAHALGELSPLDTDALEPLVQLVAGQLWRRRRAYADLCRVSVGRGGAAGASTCAAGGSSWAIGGTRGTPGRPVLRRASARSRSPRAPPALP